MSIVERTWHYHGDSTFESKQLLVPDKKGEKEKKTKLTGLSTFKNLHGIMLGVVMEDAIMSIRLLHGCNNELRITKLISDMDHLLKIKFGIKQPAIKDELEGIDNKKLGCNQYKLDKLFADRTYIEDMFTKCLIELSQGISFDTLKKEINLIENREKRIIFLTEDVANNKNTRRELLKQRRTQRNHIKSVIYDADVAIDILRNQVEDAMLMAETKTRYVHNWQNARTEQHNHQLDEKENIPNSAITQYHVRSESEIRVHGEVEALTNVLINETLNKIEEWMNKFDADMEAMDLKIRIKKNDYQNMLEKRIMLEETYAKHEQLIKDWIKFKDDREKARIYVETMTKAAIVVQAWWRGLLVRRMLGPYKVSKRKQKKK